MTPNRLEALRKAFNDGERLKFVFFWRHYAQGNELGPHCFSQWYSSPFHVDGITYVTAEHYMMAEKARLFGDEETRSQILATTNPGAVQALGRKVRGFRQETWEAHRYDIVVAGNVAKFGQASALREYLVGTRQRVLVEASPKDRTWGIGCAADDDRATNPLLWRGLNLLGFALMEARDELRR